MTDIERIAREAGLEHDARGVVEHVVRGANGNTFINPICAADLDRFAALVAEECAKVCEAERAEFMPAAANNNGTRESDFAFGSVNSAERIAAAIRAKFCK